MGQLITYAAGLHAVTIVWIANPIRDEHRAALDWLNELTEDNIRFFGLEVEVWQIGESQRAPKFDIVSKPHDWSRSTVSSVSSDGVSDHKLQQMAFWNILADEFESSAYKVRGQKPSPKHWNHYPLGRSDLSFAIAYFHDNDNSLTPLKGMRPTRTVIDR